MFFISEHAQAPTGSDKLTVLEGKEYHVRKCGGYHDISRAAEGKIKMAGKSLSKVVLARTTDQDLWHPNYQLR